MWMGTWEGRRGEEREGEGEEREGGDGDGEQEGDEGVEKKSWADPRMHSLYSDGQPVHPYQAGAAHTHHAPNVLPP